MIAVLVFQVLLAQQRAEPAGSYALVCNATSATVEVTLGESRTLAADDCHKFDLGTGYARLVKLAATANAPALRFVRTIAATSGTQAITLAAKRADCPAASDNRICVLPVDTRPPKRSHRH